MQDSSYSSSKGIFLGGPIKICSRHFLVYRSLGYMFWIMRIFLLWEAERIFRPCNGITPLSSNNLVFPANNIPQAMVRGRALYPKVSLFKYHPLRASSMVEPFHAFSRVQTNNSLCFHPNLLGETASQHQMGVCFRILLEF